MVVLMKKFVLGIIVITIVVLCFSLLSPKAETCITGQMLIVNPEFGGMVVIGDQSICGINLHYSSVTGPSKKSIPEGVLR